MAIFLEDSFVGSAGDIDGRTPDVTFGSLNWASDPGEPLNLDGTGAAESADQSAVDARGFADVGDGTTDYGLPAAVNTTFTFVVKTGASTTLGATAYDGFGLTVEAGGTYFSCGLFGPDTGDGRPWQVNEWDDGDSNAVTTPAANTEYTGTYEVADGVQTLNFMGNTKTSAVAYANPALGVNRVSVKVGAGFKLMSILAENDQAIPMNVATTMPAASSSLRTGARISASMPTPRVAATGRRSEESVTTEMPMAQVSARMGNNVRTAMPMPVASAEVTTTIMVNVQASMPSARTAAVITAPARANVTTTMPMASSAARMGNQVGAQMPRVTTLATGRTGSMISVTTIMPMASVEAQITAEGVMRVACAMPMLQPGPWGRVTTVMPMARVSIIAQSVVEVTYEAYAVNLKPGPKMPNQVTRYTNYPFNQIVRFKNRYIGVADDGLYELGGDTDYDADTPTGPPWAWHTGETDFNSPQKKNVRESMFAGRLGPSATASVSVREAVAQTYDATIVRGSSAQNHRIKYGRGLSARYWSFGWSDPDGGTCEPDAIEFEAAELGRKL